jgi:hypothetical protein
LLALTDVLLGDDPAASFGIEDSQETGSPVDGELLAYAASASAGRERHFADWPMSCIPSPTATPSTNC